MLHNVQFFYDYIYLIRTRECISRKLNIYKIGKTRTENLKRIHNYPKGSCLIIQIKTSNSDNVEKILIDLFNKIMQNADLFGREYFYGTEFEMVMHIMNVVNLYNSIKVFDLSGFISKYIEIKTDWYNFGELLGKMKNDKDLIFKKSLICERCNTLFKNNAGIKNHRKRKTPCSRVEERHNVEIADECIVTSNNEKSKQHEKNNINANDLTELKKPEQKSINISYDEFIKLTTCHNCLKKFKSKQKLYLHYLDHSNSCDIPNDS